MKSKLMRRSIAALVALAIVISLIPATNVHAAKTGTFELTKHEKYTYKFTSDFPAPFGKHLETRTFFTYKMRQSDGSKKIAYCIQYGVHANTGDTYKYQTSYSGLSSKQKKLLKRALVFGYNDKTGSLYGGSWLDNAMATQVMVWIITTGQYGKAKESKIVDICLQDNSKARKIYDKIRSNIESFDTIPSFTASTSANAKSHMMKYNPANGKYELSLTDSNKVLKYFDFKASGVSIQKNGNKVTLSTTKALNNLLVTANKKLPKDKLPTLVEGAPEYWTDPSSQDSTSLNLKGTPEKIPAYFKLTTEKLGNLKLVKKSEDGVIGGLQFHIKGNGIDKTVTTASDGTISLENLIAGNYTISEVSTPNRYVKPQTQTVSVQGGKTSSVSLSNILKKFNIYVVKSDIETGNNAQGDATFSGAEYDIFNSTGELVDHIKANGNTAKSKLLPLGTYKVYETTPPTGYNINENPVTVQGDFDGQSVEIGRADTGINDKVIKGQVAVTKFADKLLTGDNENGGVKQPLQGIEFTLSLKSTGKAVCKIVTDTDGYAITPLLPYGTYRIEETKGKEGYRKITPFDVKVNSEGKIYKYILENKVYETEVKIIKKDEETNKVIPLVGTQFKIKDSEGNWIKQKINYPKPMILDTFETAEDGTLVLPKALPAGKYTLYEVKAPNGYLISEEPISFIVSTDNPSTLLEVVCLNKPVKGTVTIEKQGEQFIAADYRQTELGKIFSPIYQIGSLQGIKFNIIAAEDIKTPDGTLRAKKGQIVDSITTASNGKVTSKNLYLGKYQIKEVTTQQGFVLLKDPIFFELTYQDQNTSIVTERANINNERQKVNVSLVKEAETTTGQTYNPYSDITFGLYAKENIKTVTGETGIEKGSLLEVIQLDQAGYGSVKTDLPVGSYYIKEISTGKGYLLNDMEYPFTFSYMGQEISYIPIHVNDGKPIQNRLMRGKIKIIKTSEDKQIEGISFKLSGITTVGTKFEKTVQTDKNGEITLDDLLTGTYEISEVIDGKTVGYITPEKQSVTVIDSNTVIANFNNKLLHGSVTINKVDMTEKPLNGATFGLFTTQGKKLQDFTIKNNGSYTIKNLLYGDYYIQELKAPKGYKLDKEKHAFSIRKNGENIKITVKNSIIPAKSNTPAKTVKTGDSGNITLLLILLGASTGLIGIQVRRWYRNRKND